MSIFRLYSRLLPRYRRRGAEAQGSLIQLRLIFALCAFLCVSWLGGAAEISAQNAARGETRRNTQKVAGRDDASLRRHYRHNLVFRRLNTEQGLSQSAVYAITQDRVGFVWIGTANGLNRFDGSEFKIFRRVDGDAASLSDNFITCLAEDRAGALWIGTRDGGLNRFDRATNTFFAFKDDSAGAVVASNYITALLYDSRGGLWVGTDAGMSYREPQSGTWKYLDNEIRAASGGNVSGTYKPRVAAFAEDAFGNIWAGTASGLYVFEWKNRRWRKFSAAPSKDAGKESGKDARKQSSDVSGGEPEDNVAALAADASGNLWLGASAQGVLRIDAASHQVLERWRALSGDDDAPTRPGGEANVVLSNNVRTIFCDGEERVWIGSAGGGLYCYDRARKTFARYGYDPAYPRSLSGDIVLAFHKDRSGAYWAGVYGNGVNVFHLQTNAFHATMCNPDNPNHVPTNSVYALAEDRRQNVWIGTERGLVRFHRPSQTMRQFQTRRAFSSASSASSPSPDFIRGILAARSGDELWIAADDGLQRFNPQTFERRFLRISPEEIRTLGGDSPIDLATHNAAFALLESRDGRIWIGTRGGGLKVFDPRRGRFVASYMHRSDAPSLSHNFVRALAEDADGRIWIGTRGGGLCRLDPATGEWKTYRHDERNPESLAHDAIFSLHFARHSRDSVLWIGTQGGGVCRMDVRAERFESWKEEHGLANNVVYGILEDRHGDLWLSTHYGVSRMSPPLPPREVAAGARFAEPERKLRQPAPHALRANHPKATFRNYNVNDGLQNNEFNAGAYCEGAGGRLYFGGLQGFNDFYADSVRVNAYIPPVALTGFRRFGEEVRLERDISLLDTLLISYKDNFFSLEFAALSFIQSDENRFMYRLEGIEKQWVHAGARHEARYTNVPGGVYTFRVKASNNDGVWNETGRALVVVVTPPLWERWQFRVIAACVLITAALLVYRSRMRRMQKFAESLQKEVQTRTAELRESNERLHNANEEIQRQIALLDEQTREIEVANAALQEKNIELEEERRTSESLILNVLPRSIAARLRSGEARIADAFDSVTVLFADIVGFTELAAQQSPGEVVEILNSVFSAFDIFSERYGLEKIKTIGDAYMIVGGAPEPINDHQGAIADMALEMLETLNILRYTLNVHLQVRIGVHTGPVVAGIIGQKKFSYDLWGDTVNTASRMESHGETGKIHCSAAVYEALRDRYEFSPPRSIEVKGKGAMLTYFLLGKKSSREHST